jgi:hypothetical protein
MLRRKLRFLGCGMLLVLLLASGCSLLARDFEAAPVTGWYLQLRIQVAAAAKGITVSEFDVTGLNIQVRDPQGEMLQSIDWAAAEGPQTYLVPVKKQGEHQLEVTHFAELDGQPVQASESAAFSIQSMKITVIDIVPGGIGLVWVTPPQNGLPQDGTITGRLTGADAFNGLGGAFLVFPAAAEITPDNSLGAGMLLIVGGSAEGIVKESVEAVDPIVFPGGGLYDVYAYIDLGGDDFPTSGDWWAGPKTVQVNGNMLVDFTYPNDFEQLVYGIPSIWQPWGTWANEEYNGGPGPAAKVVSYESGMTELYRNVYDEDPFETVQMEITGEWSDEQAHWFRHLGPGPIYVLTRLFNDGNTFTNRSSDTGYPDPSEFGPDYEDYFVIYYRQE